MEKGKRKIKYSVQFTFLAIFVLFIAVMIVLLTTYPTTSTRDVVFSSKRSSMLSQATVMSSSLSVLDSLGEENVNQVMELVDVKSFDRVVVTNSSGVAIYDSSSSDDTVGRWVYFPEIVKSLSGWAAFSSTFDGVAFSSKAATPVFSNGTLIGSVYLSEYETDSVELINSIQDQLSTIAIISGILVLVLIILSTKALTSRITTLVRAMRIVREGNYDYQVSTRGYDEVSELAETFNNMTNRLKSTEELRRRFVSDASHELRTPLAAIRLLSDSILQNENMDKETMLDFVSDIGTEADRLQRMTEKLMSLTKTDSKTIYEPELVDIKKVVEKTIHLLTPLAEDGNVVISTNLQSGCEIMASGDDMYQIIFNLAENAIKYNEYGGSVFINLHKENGKAVLTVEDTGIGIPEVDVPHIFSRFYRVDKARSRSSGGSGLGLSIAHDAVKLHGGEISVERRLPNGTAFVVAFPLAQKEEGDE